MKLKSVLLGLLSSLLPIACHADSITVQFDLGFTLQPGPPVGPGITPYSYVLSSIPSVGSLTLTLLSNGEISANVISTGGAIFAFAYEGPGYLGFQENHDFSPVTPGDPSGAAYTQLGSFQNGFNCELVDCGQQLSFLIGEPGEFSSVYNIAGPIGGGLDPGDPLLVNFFLGELPGGLPGEFGADVAPEPSYGTLILLIGLAIAAAKVVPITPKRKAT